MALTKVTAGVVDNSTFFTFKNKIINGAMQVAQRGTTGTSSRSLDMWVIETRNGGVTINWAQSTDVPTNEGFPFSQRIYATNSTDDGFHLRTYVELPGTGNYGEFVAGSRWTLSFWMKSAYTGRTINPYLYLSDSSTGSTNSSAAAYSDQGVQTLSQSWTKYTFTFTLPTWTVDSGSLSSVKCLVVRLLQGINDTPQDTYITGVQFEKGSAATPFEMRPFGAELELCQRYFEKTFSYDVVPSNGNSGTNLTEPQSAAVLFSGHRGKQINSSYAPSGYRFKVVKRAAPTITVYGNSSGYPAYRNSGGFDSSVSWITGVMTWNITGMTDCVYVGNEFDSTGSSWVYAHFTASAEL